MAADSVDDLANRMIDYTEQQRDNRFTVYLQCNTPFSNPNESRRLKFGLSTEMVL